MTPGFRSQQAQHGLSGDAAAARAWRRGARIALAGLALAILLAWAPHAGATGSDAATGNYGYVWVDKPLAYDEIRSSATSSWETHDVTVGWAFPPSFAFRMYGSPYTSALVSDNGFIGLGATAGTSSQQYTPQQIPNGNDPNLLIAPFWVDMEQACLPDENSPPPGSSGQILGKFEPANPPYRDRMGVVEWDGISLYGESGECSRFNTFQLHLFEGTDIMEFEYIATHTYATHGIVSACQSAGIGIESSTGSPGLNYGWHPGCAGDWVFSNQARRIFKNDPNGADLTIPVNPGVPTSFQLTSSNDPLVYTLVAAPPASAGTLSSNFPAAGQTYYKPAANMTFTPSASFCGTATLQFQANDLFDPVTTYTLTFQHDCGPANTAPTAACSVLTPTPITTGQAVSFSSAGSADPDAGDTLTYAWTFPSGTPGTATTASPSATWSAAGTYAVSLVVTDNHGLPSAAANCPVTVTSSSQPPPPPPPNPPPTGCGLSAAFALPSGDVVYGQNVAFQDRSQPSAGASLVSWQWSFGDGYTATTEGAQHVYGNSGDYQVSLSAGDTAGCVGTVVQLLHVGTPPPEGAPDPGTGPDTQPPAVQPPTVNAPADVTATEGEEVHLEAVCTASSGAPLSFQWVQTAGPSVALAGADAALLRITAPAATNERDATLAFGVTCSDGYATSAQDVVQVLVRPRNHAPNARAGPDLTVAPGETFTLTAAASSDADGDELTFTWDQVGTPGVAAFVPIAGLPATGRSVTLTAPAAGSPSSFDVVLTASDGQAEGADTVRVWVRAPGAEPAAFVAQPQPDGVVQFTATAEAAQYAWDFGDGETTVAAEPGVQHRYASGGSYHVTLTVDGQPPAAQDVVAAPPSQRAVPQAAGAGSAAANGTAIGLAGAAVAAILVGGLLVWALRRRPQ